MPNSRVLFVDSAVHPAGDGVLSAVSDDQQYRRQWHSSLSGTLAPCYADTDGLWWRACTGLNLPHRASASRYVAAATVHGHNCAFHWWGGAAALSTRCSRDRSRCTSKYHVACPPGLWQKRGQVSWWTCRPVTIELIEAGEDSRNILHKCWKHVYPDWGRMRRSRRAHEHGPMLWQYPN